MEFNKALLKLDRVALLVTDHAGAKYTTRQNQPIFKELGKSFNYDGVCRTAPARP